jgi:hypothetical protein
MAASRPCERGFGLSGAFDNDGPHDFRRVCRGRIGHIRKPAVCDAAARGRAPYFAPMRASFLAFAARTGAPEMPASGQTCSSGRAVNKVPLAAFRAAAQLLGNMRKGSVFVATATSFAFLFAGTATSVFPVLLGRHEAPWSILISTEAAAVLAAIVWVGSYIGARISLPEQRTGRFLTLTAAVHALVGAVMAFPVKTHAVPVNIDGPFPGRAAWNIAAAVSYACFAAALFSPLIVKGIASACSSRAAGDAKHALLRTRRE